MLRAACYKSCKKHPTKRQLCGLLPPILLNIQVLRAKHARHCWWSKAKRINDVLFWTPSNGPNSFDRTAKTYIHKFCANTICRSEDLPRTIADTDGCQVRREFFLSTCVDDGYVVFRQKINKIKWNKIIFSIFRSKFSSWLYVRWQIFWSTFIVTEPIHVGLEKYFGKTKFLQSYLISHIQIVWGKYKRLHYINAWRIRFLFNWCKFSFRCKKISSVQRKKAIQLIVHEVIL